MCATRTNRPGTHGRATKSLHDVVASRKLASSSASDKDGAQTSSSWLAVPSSTQRRRRSPDARRTVLSLLALKLVMKDRTSASMTM